MKSLTVVVLLLCCFRAVEAQETISGAISYYCLETPNGFQLNVIYSKNSDPIIGFLPSSQTSPSETPSCSVTESASPVATFLVTVNVDVSSNTADNDCDMTTNANERSWTFVAFRNYIDEFYQQQYRLTCDITNLADPYIFNGHASSSLGLTFLSFQLFRENGTPITGGDTITAGETIMAQTTFNRLAAGTPPAVLAKRDIFLTNCITSPTSDFSTSNQFIDSNGCIETDSGSPVEGTGDGDSGFLLVSSPNTIPSVSLVTNLTFGKYESTTEMHVKCNVSFCDTVSNRACLDRCSNDPIPGTTTTVLYNIQLETTVTGPAEPPGPGPGTNSAQTAATLTSGIVAGSAVGGLLLLVCIALCALLALRSRRRRKKKREDRRNLDYSYY